MSAHADLEPLTELEQRTLRRTQLLKLKAEAELLRLEKNPPTNPEKKTHEPSPAPNGPTPGAPQPKPVDPKELKAGYQKAIELAPKAADQMDRAVKALKQKDAKAAYPPAEEARKILEEIQKAQPKQDQQDQKQQQEDQKKNDQQKQDQKDQKNDDQQKKDQQKNDQQKKDDPKKKDQEKDRSKIKRRKIRKKKNRSRKSRTEEAGRREQVW